MSEIKLYHGDCLEVMKSISDKTIDCIITDPPFGITNNKWDSVIDITIMWQHLNRIIKDKGAILLFGQPPFSSMLIMSNIKMFRYEYIWCKNLSVGFLNANKMPLRATENISVFYKNLPTYNPQMRYDGTPYIKYRKDLKSANYGEHKGQTGINTDGSRYPNNLLYYNNSDHLKLYHPTQKPVALCEYLIKTYTNKNETILDFTIGSGSTGVACKRLNRNFIGIELDKNYFEIAKERIENTTKNLF